ncbi:hypothetical protein IFM89_028662 [Coptis chinensis]|uniref:Senescence regulator n=1 Tax=Coptis chinensis TaxID=261450 RepID=A0A835H304_9MAGN|nr:hypothetical protein IFM89_028662 [Coptis chinensis]
MEEFQESEVLWPDHHDNNIHKRELQTLHTSFERKMSMKKTDSTHSRPIHIPEKSMCSLQSNWLEYDSFEDEEEEKMLPPHEMLARRLNGKMAFSVCTGNGRTLKGRDLSKVRNSILRRTGFLEAC